MEPPMRLTYSLAKSDLIEGMMLQARLWRKFAVFGLLVFAALVAVEINAKGVPTTADRFVGIMAAPLTMGLGVALVFPLSRRFVTWPLLIDQHGRQNPRFYRDLELLIDSDGVRINGTGTDFQSRWSGLQGLRESASVFVLCVSKSVGHVVPKSALSTEEISQLRDLLSANLKRLS
jgi:hypothetical protein